MSVRSFFMKSHHLKTFNFSSSNLRFCYVSISENSIQPRIYAQQVFDEYEASKLPQQILNWTSSRRKYNNVPPIFNKIDLTYEAYEKDIAEVRVFHNTPTVFWYQV